MANETKQQSKQAELTPGRLRLKTWRGNLQITDTSAQNTVVLGGSVNLGGDGTCKVTSLELEPATNIVYYTLESQNVGGRVRHMVMQGEGYGELA